MTEQSTPAESGDDGPPKESAGDNSEVPTIERLASLMDSAVNGIELAAAALFALLFAVGVADLALIIAQATLAGNITDPQVVINLIDVGLLLLIIVEVYQTVVAYIRESDTRTIVRLVIYTGVIALVRKAIIYRTAEYNSIVDALLVAVAYTILIFGLVALLYVERQTSHAG